LEIAPVFAEPTYQDVTEDMKISEVKQKGGTFVIFDTRGSPLTKQLSDLSGMLMMTEDDLKKVKKELDSSQKLISFGKKALQNARTEAQECREQLKQKEEESSVQIEALNRQNKDLQEQLLEKERELLRLKDELFNARDQLDISRTQLEALKQSQKEYTIPPPQSLSIEKPKSWGPQVKYTAPGSLQYR
jgi:chromosome segregation ATPase